MICIPGVGCIPTEVLLGALLVLLKPIYDYLVKLLYGKDVVKSKNEVESVPNAAAATSLVEAFDSVDSPYVLKKDDSFKLRLQMTKKVVILRFTQSACKPCKAMEPFYNNLAVEVKEKATFITIDVNDHEELAIEFHAFKLPYFISFKNNEHKGFLNTCDESKFKEFVLSKIE